MGKLEVAWKRKDDEGEKVQVYAKRHGGEWRFFWRNRRYDQWQPSETPPLEDWLELLDGVKRRVQRDLLPLGEDQKIRKLILEHYPDAELD